MSKFNHSGRVVKHPYMRDEFWLLENNHFWRYNGINYTPASIERFEGIVEEARILNDRWSKPDIKNLSKR